MKNYILNLFYIYLILISLTGCNETCKHCEVAKATMISYSEERYIKDQWILSSYGGSYYDLVRELSLSYDICEKKMNLDEIRTNFVTAVESFLYKINHDSNLRPYLNHYPFTYLDIKFGLSFIDRTGNFVEDPEIGCVILIKDQIHYAVQDRESEQLKTFYREPYTEAYKIVTGKDYQNPQGSQDCPK